MLEDRDYMREPAWRGGSRSVTAIICFVLIGAFVLQSVAQYYFGSRILDDYLSLTLNGVRHGWVWQLLTFQLLHGGVFHLIGNLIGLWCFGRPVERILGRQRFLAAFFGCGAIGGVLQGLLMLMFPQHFGMYVVGASAGIFAMLAMYAVLDPAAVILLDFIFPVRVIWLLYFFGSLSLYFTLFPQADAGVANAAHLGGILAGIAWIKLGWHHDYIKPPWETWFAPREKKMPASKRRPTLVVHEDAAAQASAREVDQILEKISAQGIGSLTAREREILESARRKMSQQ